MTPWTPGCHTETQSESYEDKQRVPMLSVNVVRFYLSSLKVLLHSHCIGGESESESESESRRQRPRGVGVWQSHVNCWADIDVSLAS